ncbi:siderophore-interacting protein [Psychrobacter sp. AOP22-C1-C5]|uniref:siderophore-interacting protein n=1 Tax=Psychrobacter sp. AOP22-C1-C5 TaxID=3457716 RepID=UPI00403651D2
MAQPVAQDVINKTPLIVADKDLFVDHINDEHQDELVMFINIFTKASIREDSVPSIVELYPDGMLLALTGINNDQDNPENTAYPIEQHFINFMSPVDDTTSLNEQYIALLQRAATKLGKRTIKLREQLFTVIDGYYASPNMYRLLVTAPDNTPLHQAGYAYLLDLNASFVASKLASAQQNDADDSDSTNEFQGVYRYYSLRKAWRDSDSASVHAWIDVYIHGDTPGGNWARSLGTGAQIKSVREYPEKLDHLTDGQCLLICDETSLPTVANLLENWQNPLSPLVIAITNDPKDISYLHNITLSKRLSHDKDFKQENLLHIINVPKTSITDQILTTLNTRLAVTSTKIDKVWGALEAADIKSLRPQLKSVLGLSRQDMTIQVYWRV